MQRTEAVEGGLVIAVLAGLSWMFECVWAVMQGGELPLGIMAGWWVFGRGLIRPPVQVSIQPALSLGEEGPHHEMEIILKNTVRRRVSIKAKVTGFEGTATEAVLDLAPAQVFPLARVIRRDDFSRDGRLEIGWNLHPWRVRLEKGRESLKRAGIAWSRIRQARTWGDATNAAKSVADRLTTRTTTLRASGLAGLERTPSINQGGLLRCAQRLAGAAEAIVNSRNIIGKGYCTKGTR